MPLEGLVNRSRGFLILPVPENRSFLLKAAFEYRVVDESSSL